MENYMHKLKEIIIRKNISIFSLPIIILIGIIIFIYVSYSLYIRNDYVNSISDDGGWEIYLIPDMYGNIGGYLVYRGDVAGAASPENNNVSQRNKEGLKEENIIKLKYTSNGIENIWNKNELEKTNGRESVLLKTGTEKLLLSKISYYELWAVECGDTEEDLTLEIVWEKDGEQKKSMLSAEYDKFNIHKYWGMFMDYTWKKEMGIEN